MLRACLCACSACTLRPWTWRAASWCWSPPPSSCLALQRIPPRASASACTAWTQRWERLRSYASVCQPKCMLGLKNDHGRADFGGQWYLQAAAMHACFRAVRGDSHAHLKAHCFLLWGVFLCLTTHQPAAACCRCDMSLQLGLLALRYQFAPPPGRPATSQRLMQQVSLAGTACSAAASSAYSRVRSQLPCAGTAGRSNSRCHLQVNQLSLQSTWHPVAGFFLRCCCFVVRMKLPAGCCCGLFRLVGCRWCLCTA